MKSYEQLWCASAELAADNNWPSKANLNPSRAAVWWECDGSNRGKPAETELE